MTGTGREAAQGDRRWVAFDVLRGIGILGVVILHASLFHYARLLSIDFANPPVIVTVIGILLMWAGLFAMVSSAVNAARTWRRHERGDRPRTVLAWSLASGGAMLVVAYLYFLVLGPALLDRVHGNHDYSVLMELIMRGRLAAPSLERLLYVDSLVMISFNIVLVALVLWALRRTPAGGNAGLTGAILLVIGGAVVLASYARIWLYPVVESAIARRDLLTALPLAYVANKNNPILPFFGFGCVGAALGTWLAADRRWRAISRTFVPFGIAWLLAGVVGYATLPDTMLERAVDPMWFYIMVAQVGLFALLVAGSLRFFDFAPPERAARRAAAVTPLRRFGVAALTVFVFETLVSELVARLLTALAPGWNDTMAGALTFGFGLAALWAVALFAWEKTGFPFPVEAVLATALRSAGKPTTRPDRLEKDPASGPFEEPAAATRAE